MNAKRLKTKFFSVAIAVVFVAVLLCAAVATNTIAYAADDLPVVSVDNVSVHAGQRFEVAVRLSNNTGLVSMRLFVTCDSDQVTFVEYKVGNALRACSLDHGFDSATKTHVFNWIAYNPGFSDNSNGVLVTLVFDSKVDCTVDNVNVVLGADNVFSAYKVEQEVSLANGTVQVKKDSFYYVFVDSNGNVLQRSALLPFGSAVPTFTGATPTCPDDSKYSYTFSGWQPTVSTVANEVWLAPTFDKIAKQYSIEFFVAESRSEKPQKVDTYTQNNVAFGTELALPQPTKEGYLFVGWFVDENFTTKFDSNVMLDENVKLYGFYRFALREQGPVVQLSYGGMDGAYLLVNVDMLSNNGVCNMKLSLTYDRTALSLVGYQQGVVGMNLSTSGTEDTYPYAFMWSANDNCFDTGRLVTLKFAVNSGVQTGGYKVALSYNANSDAVYMDSGHKLCFTAVDINDFTLPVGTVDNWTATTGQQTVNVATSVAELGNVSLVVDNVTHQVVVDDKLQSAFGEGNEVKAAYEIRLSQDGVTVQPNGKLLVRIKLTSRQLMCNHLVLYHYGDDGSVTRINATVRNGYIEFETDHLSTWLIVGEVTNIEEKDCPVWIMMVLAGITALMCIIAAYGGRKFAVKLVGILWSVATVAAGGWIVYSHVCMYTALSSVLLVLLVFALMREVLRTRDHVKGTNVVYKVRGGKTAGCYVVSGKDGEYVFDVRDGGNKVLAFSAMEFDTFGAVKQGISLCRNNSAVANLTDEDGSFPRFAVDKSNGKWRFSLVLSDNYVVLRSIGYASKNACVQALANTKEVLRSLTTFVDQGADE